MLEKSCKIGMREFFGRRPSRLSCSIDIDNFKFDNSWGPVNAFEQLVNLGINSPQLTAEWVDNHYRLLVWKWISYCKQYPEIFPDSQYLKPSIIFNQLCYRVEKEIHNGKRPIFRKMSEKDVPFSLTIVVVVFSILNENSILISDGWYCLQADLDESLKAYLSRGKIFVGQKLRVSGATCKSESSDGVPILEAGNGRIVLHLNANGVMRAKWDTNLGLAKCPWMFRLLKDVKGSGGNIPCMKLTISRMYQTIFVEKVNGKRFARSLEEEELEQQQYSVIRFRFCPDLLQKPVI